MNICRDGNVKSLWLLTDLPRPKCTRSFFSQCGLPLAVLMRCTRNSLAGSVIGSGCCSTYSLEMRKKSHSMHCRTKKKNITYKNVCTYLGRCGMPSRY